jgi:hypothetical protein
MAFYSPGTRPPATRGAKPVAWTSTEYMEGFDGPANVSPHGRTVRRPNDSGLACGSNMLPGGCEVQAERPSDPLAHPVRFKPLLGSIFSHSPDRRSTRELGPAHARKYQQGNDDIHDSSTPPCDAAVAHDPKGNRRGDIRGEMKHHN